MVTKRYCSNQCIKRASKERLKAGKLKELSKRIVKKSKRETKQGTTVPRVYYTPSEAAEFMRCSRRHVYRLMDDGYLPYRQLSERKRLIAIEDLQHYLDSVKVNKEQNKKLVSFDFDNAISIRDAQLVYGIAPLNILNIAKSRDIQHIKVGDIYFFNRSGLAQYFKQHGKG